MRYISILAVFLALLNVNAAFAIDSGITGQKVKLGGLNKTTARVEQFEIEIGQIYRFERLEIIARACEKAPPIKKPESTVFLSIVEEDFDSTKASIFNGWMYASSPTLNALDHPLYDIWVLECVVVES